jgi:hypothetical protein
MQIIITHHARIRMLERHVSEEDISFTLSNYLLSRPGRDGGTGFYALMMDGSTVVVWVAQELPLTSEVVVKSVGREVSK